MWRFFHFVFSALVSQEWWHFMQWCGKVQLDHTQRECVQRCMKHGQFEELSRLLQCRVTMPGLVGFLDVCDAWDLGDKRWKGGSLLPCELICWPVNAWPMESRHFVFCAKICFQDNTQQDGLHKVKQYLTYSKTFSKSLFLGAILRIFQHCLQVWTPIILLQNALCAKKKHVTWRWIAHREQCRHAGLASRGRLPNLECHDNDTFFLNMFFSTFSFSSTTATTAAAAAALLPLQQQISLPFKFAHLSNLLSSPVLHAISDL